MDFYGQVLRELMVALGAAMLVANVFALVRRRRDRDQAARAVVARSRPGSPVRGLQRDGAATSDLPQAPLVRSVTYAAIGFVVMIWGVASIVG